MDSSQCNFQIPVCPSCLLPTKILISPKKKFKELPKQSKTTTKEREKLFSRLRKSKSKSSKRSKMQLSGCTIGNKRDRSKFHLQRQRMKRRRRRERRASSTIINGRRSLTTWRSVPITMWDRQMLAG
jgi:hypothetical protein